MRLIQRRLFVATALKGAAGLTAGVSLLRGADELQPARGALEAVGAKGRRSSRKPGQITLHLRKRDPKSGEPAMLEQALDPARAAIVVVDTWNYHWCKTCSARLSAMIPRLNRALAGARKLGLQIVFVPTDSITPYQKWPQRRAVLAMPELPPPPKLSGFEMPGCPVGGDPCGPGSGCVLNYGETMLHPDLQIGRDDLISEGAAELYKICRHRGLTHLIYAGIATNICVIGKPEAVLTMVRYGMTCYLSRDLTDAFGYPPQRAQDVSVAHIERYACPSIDVIGMLREHGCWDDRAPVDPVLISPWGKRDRPYFFERATQVFLEQPRLAGAPIHYTLDGSEPTPRSPRYDQPIPVSATTTLRARAFREGQPVGLPSEAYYVKLPASPPFPSVRLFDLTPTYESSGWGGNERRVPTRLYNLRIRGQDYRKGLFVHAPSELRYELKPEYDRFVALAGVDDSVLALNAGRNLGSFPSVVFQVYLDDRLVAESPVMRVSEGPWRFDVKIPQGSKYIRLVVTDAGDGIRLDLADWCNSGFVVPDYRGWEQSP